MDTGITIDTDEEKTEEPKPTEDSGDGDKPTTTTLVDEANLAAERLEEANKRKTELLKQEEELIAKRRLSGEAEAGQESVKKSEDEKWAEDAKERYAGTGMSPVEDDDGK